MPAIELIHGNVKAKTLRDVLADAKQVVVISAYTTLAGFAEVRKPIAECLKRGGSVTLLLGLDRGGVTSAELIRDLAAMQKKAGEKLEILLVIEHGRTFLHAKVFAARKPGSAEVLVGSFNLTGSGLGDNHELAVRLSGASTAFFTELDAFINSIDDKRRLTADNAADVVAALDRGPTITESPEVAAERREAAKDRMEKLLKALDIAPERIATSNDVSTQLAKLQSLGAFWAYEFDLEKLNVPSGLASFYARGLLPREKTGAVGTAKTRRPTALTAGFPLVPPGRQQQYSRLAKRMGKAFRACGFETPYGWWIPDAYLERLEAMVAEIVARLPSPTKLVTEVKAYIAKHKEDLEETTDAIVQLATDHGIQHPSMWTDARDEALASLKSRYRESPVESWPSSTGHAEAIKYIRSSLLLVADKLDADLAIAKLQRVRPQLLRVPVTYDDTVIRRLLECMTWAALEDRGERNTKPAVRELSLARRGKARQPKVLTELSQSLLDGADGAEAAFFGVFGPPPYWKATNASLSLEDDDGEE